MTAIILIKNGPPYTHQTRLNRDECMLRRSIPANFSWEKVLIAITRWVFAISLVLNRWSFASTPEMRLETPKAKTCHIRRPIKLWI